MTGEPYAGFDRHNGEIAGFFLDRSVCGHLLSRHGFRNVGVASVCWGSGWPLLW